MITLHESNITSFPHDNGIGVLKDVIRAYAEEELNGLFEFYMEYDSEGHLVDELKEERIIKAKAQDKLGYQLFRIYSITKNHDNDNLIVRAQHITYDLADNFVEKLEANNLTKKQVMELIGSSTVLPHPFFVTSSNTTTRSSTKLYRTNPLQMIGGIEGSVLQIWGGQIERDNFNLILHDRRGSDDGVKVTYEKNITGLTAEFDISGLVTRIFPFVYIEATDNEPARLITVSGKYIDSPHINDYEKIYIRPIDYTHDERINLDGTDTQIRQQLTNIANSYFTETGNDKIKVDMEVQFEHLWETEEYKDLAVLELVGMGDTVTIEHSRLKVNATAIVNYIRYDCIAEKNEEVRLGSVKARLTDNVNRVVDVAEKVEQAQQTANQAIRTANGKNTIYYGPDEPTNGIEGDLWFRVIDGEYTRTYRHDGIQWQLVLSVDVRDAIDEAQQAKDDAKQAVDRANQATQQATNAINQAQTAFDEAQNALGTASNAYDIATTLQGDVTNLSTLVDEHTGQISSITQSVTGLQTHVSDIEGNVSTLTQMVSNLTTQISDIDGNVTTLQQTSSSLAARLTDAEGNITTLTATVDGLQTTVSDIDGNVSDLTQLSTTLQSRLSDAEGNINTLTQTVDSTVSRISSLANPNLITHNPSEWIELFGLKVVYGGIPVKKNTNYVLTDYSSELVDKIQINYDGKFFDGVVGGVFKFNTGDGDDDWVGFVVSSSDPDFFKKLGTVYRFKLEEGTESTAWTAHDEDIYTQYSQLSDAINLRVAKGDVINQINISTESILIDGKRIHITGQTTIDNGVIKSAHIESLDAGKITVGDLVGHSLVGGSVIGGYIEQQSGGNRVEIYNGTVSHYRYGELKSVMDGSGHKFYQSGSYIGKIGTLNWIDDLSYKGLSFNLENDADFMSWAHKKTADATVYTTMLAWHKTSNKDNKGFTFYDNVHISSDSNLYVNRILTTGYVDGSRAVELQNYTWNGDNGVILTRAPNRNQTSAGLFMTANIAVLKDGGNAYIEVGNDSTGNYVKSTDIWNRTSTNSSNVRVDSSGKLYRTSSASKYKLLIENEEEKGYNYNNILKLNIKSWYDKLEADTLCDLITNDLTDCENEVKFYLRRHFGLVAEDLEEAGLKEFIDYNDETGEIEGIKYDRLWTLLIPIARQHRDDIELLKLENQYLKQKVKQLEEMIV